MDHPGVPLNPYTIHMILGNSIIAHIPLMHAVMVAYM